MPASERAPHRVGRWICSRHAIESGVHVVAKPVSRTAIRLDGDPVGGKLDATWDSIDVTSAIDGVAYQRGTLAALRMPSDLIARATARDHTGDLVIFCGTVPRLDGAFRYGKAFSATLGTGQEPLRLEHSVRIEPDTAAS